MFAEDFMRLYFIRHGQSENNLLWDQTGSDADRSDDPRLTQAGWEQARLTGEYLRAGSDLWDGEGGSVGFQLTHLYCSPMFRALATGTVISQAVRLPLRIWTDWHECGGMFLQDRTSGEFKIKPGMTSADILRHFPEVILDERMGDSGWWNRPFETDEERVGRARRIVDELLVRHGGGDDRVAVVSHGGFYVRFVARMMEREDTRPVWLRMNNTGVSRFDFREKEHALVFHNTINHLPARLVT
jgi:2,3-bisphosphoglycerate-dependent phosphoglycerate mutase